jgi:hypothetical protein
VVPPAGDVPVRVVLGLVLGHGHESSEILR